MKAPNLFKTLSKYGSREAEDYLTESFVILIKILLEQTPDDGLRLLNVLCGLTGAARFDNAEFVQVSTQVVIDAGRLDIEVRSGTDTLAFIEIKHDAPRGGLARCRALANFCLVQCIMGRRQLGF